MKGKKKQSTPLAVCQLRGGQSHPFGALQSFVPLGGGEEMIYQQLREAIPVLDAAVGKLVRLSGTARLCVGQNALPDGYFRRGIAV